MERFTLRPCDCTTRATYSEVRTDDVADLLDGFAFVSSTVATRHGREMTVDLYRCRVCRALWLVEFVGMALVVRVESEAAAVNFDDRPYRRALVVARHGGLGDDTCAYAGCDQHTLGGMAICTDHAYPGLAGAGPVPT